LNYLEIEINKSKIKKFDISIKKIPSNSSSETQLQIKFFLAVLEYIL